MRSDARTGKATAEKEGETLYRVLQRQSTAQRLISIAFCQMYWSGDGRKPSEAPDSLEWFMVAAMTYSGLCDYR